jgi:putative FmdB family regulatory protein
MPLFDFHCRQCGHDFEALVRPQAPAVCPSCRSQDLEKQMSAFAVTSSDQTRAFAAAKRKKAAAVAHRDNAAIERELDAHRTEDH